MKDEDDEYLSSVFRLFWRLLQHQDLVFISLQFIINSLVTPSESFGILDLISNVAILDFMNWFSKFLISCMLLNGFPKRPTMVQHSVIQRIIYDEIVFWMLFSWAGALAECFSCFFFSLRFHFHADIISLSNRFPFKVDISFTFSFFFIFNLIFNGFSFGSSVVS